MPGYELLDGEDRRTETSGTFTEWEYWLLVGLAVVVPLYVLLTAALVV